MVKAQVSSPFGRGQTRAAGKAGRHTRQGQSSQEHQAWSRRGHGPGQGRSRRGHQARRGEGSRLVKAKGVGQGRKARRKQQRCKTRAQGEVQWEVDPGARRGRQRWARDSRNEDVRRGRQRWPKGVRQGGPRCRARLTRKQTVVKGKADRKVDQGIGQGSPESGRRCRAH